MRAIVINEYGSNDVVTLSDVDRPAPGAGELLLKVEAAGVNPVDWKIREGAGARMGMTLPIRLGSEIAATVEAVGEGGEGLAIGDAVYGIVKSGGFADYVIAPAADMARKPSNLDFVHAAAVPLGALTAWQAMFDLAKLSGGQRLLITNASGGVGSLAVQLAKEKGAHVTAVASTHNEGYVLSLGADEFVDYTRQPFEDVARDMDVVFDTVGEDSFARSFKVLRKGGFLVTSVAFPKEEDAQRGIGVARVLCKPNAGQLAEICGLIEAGKLNPVVATTFPLGGAKDALALSQAGRTRGKIVLTIAA